jgi:hypothetical protein
MEHGTDRGLFAGARRRGRRIGWVLALLAFGAALGRWSSHARADAGHEAQPLVYSGILEEGGQPVTRTSMIGVWLFDSEKDGAELCAAPTAPIDVDRGRFSVVLPPACAAAATTATALWVEVRVDGKPLSPRARVSAVPYALGARNAEGATGKLRSELDSVKSDLAGKLTVSGHQMAISPQGNVGIGTGSPDLPLTVAGDTRIGEVLSAMGSPGWGSALVFSGAPKVAAAWDSDNSDALWMARYNVAPDVTELRVVIGDNPNSAIDRFAIGVMTGNVDFSKTSTWIPKLAVDSQGNVTAAGTVQANGSPDIAETIPADDAVRGGDAVCADLAHRERAVRCKKGDTAVLGVIAGDPSSFLINAGGRAVGGPPTGKPLVLAGRVPVKVSLDNGPIRVGDALALSSHPGAVVRAVEPGPVVGIALEATDGRAGAPESVLCFVQPGEGGASVLAAENARLRAENAAIEARLASLEKAVSDLTRPLTSHLTRH